MLITKELKYSLAEDTRLPAFFKYYLVLEEIDKHGYTSLRNFHHNHPSLYRSDNGVNYIDEAYVS